MNNTQSTIINPVISQFKQNKMEDFNLINKKDIEILSKITGNNILKAI
jgi:hypothetical protein